LLLSILNFLLNLFLMFLNIWSTITLPWSDTTIVLFSSLLWISWTNSKYSFKCFRLYFLLTSGVHVNNDPLKDHGHLKKDLWISSTSLLSNKSSITISLKLSFSDLQKTCYNMHLIGSVSLNFKNITFLQN